MTASGWLASVLALLLQVSPDDAQREAEIFGEAAATPTPLTPPSDEAQEPSTTSDFSERVQRGNDALAIGGFTFLRVQYDILSEGEAADFKLNSPNLVNLYFDARPSERVRGYLRGRVLYDPAITNGQPSPLTLRPMQQTMLLLDQLWLKFDLGRAVYVTVGRQRVRWGVGRFWNPTDFLNRFRLDPLAIFDPRLGATLVKLNVPIETLGYNFYAVANLTDVKAVTDTGGALRAEFVVGDAELAVTAAKALRQGPWQLGFDASGGLGLFDLKFESTAQYGVQQTFFEAQPGVSGRVPVERKQTWFFQALAGAEVTLRYSDEDMLTVGVEYFYNQLGYPDATYYPAASVNFFSQGQPIPFLYLGQHYMAGFVHLPHPGRFDNGTLTLSAIGNLSDMSALARLDLQVRLLTYMDFNAYGTYHFGQQGELRYPLRIPAGQAPGLPNGFSQAAPRSEVGIGLRLYF